MWERTLQDLIRGLRANKKDEAKFIAQAVDEIRKEIKGEDMELKAGAVLKLTYVRSRTFLHQSTSLIHVLAGHDGLRHELGLVSRRRSYELPEIPSQERRFPPHL